MVSKYERPAQRSLLRRIAGRATQELRNLGRRVSNFGLYPIAWILSKLSATRYVSLANHRIGHLALDTDCFFKEMALAATSQEANMQEVVALTRETEPCNPALMEYWKTYAEQNGIRLLDGRDHPFLRRLSSLSPTGIPTVYNTGISVSAVLAGRDFRMIRGIGKSSYQVYHDWGDRHPLLSLSNEHRQRCREAMVREWGISESDWFVCLHNREAGWDRMIDSDAKAGKKDFRNSDIATYQLAAKAVAEAGGWVIRMGDSTMTRLAAAGWERTIDYAHSGLKSDWMDLFLCANARFFLGTNSGLFALSTVFGVPSAMCNLVPMTGMALLKGDLCVPKLLRSRETGRLVPFPEILQSQYHLSNNGDLYDHWGLEIIDNTPEEIADLALEAMAKLDGSFEEHEEDDELQIALLGLIGEGHMCYQSASEFATSFLRRHRDLVLPS